MHVFSFSVLVVEENVYAIFECSRASTHSKFWTVRYEIGGLDPSTHPSYPLLPPSLPHFPGVAHLHPVAPSLCQQGPPFPLPPPPPSLYFSSTRQLPSSPTPPAPPRRQASMRHHRFGSNGPVASVLHCGSTNRLELGAPTASASLPATLSLGPPSRTAGHR